MHKPIEHTLNIFEHSEDTEQVDNLISKNQTLQVKAIP